jgi:hypothetical protein
MRRLMQKANPGTVGDINEFAGNIGSRRGSRLRNSNASKDCKENVTGGDGFRNPTLPGGMRVILNWADLPRGLISSR